MIYNIIKFYKFGDEELKINNNLIIEDNNIYNVSAIKISLFEALIKEGESI